MQIDRMPAYFILAALGALLCTATVLAMSQQPNANIIELNDSTLNSTLAKYPFFILDCYSSGCDPCERMNLSIHELSLELNGQATFGLIDAKKNNRTARRYNITSYPTLLIFKNGTFIEKDVGFGSKEGIVEILRRLKPDLNTSKVTSIQPSAHRPNIQKNCTDIKKLEHPLMQAFLVSYCPFGLQMQRILSGIISKMPSLSKNIKVRYIIEMTGNNVTNMTSMHGPTESDENLRQICIREEQSSKYWKYVSCFTNSSNSSQCIKSAGVDDVLLKGCLSNDSRGLRYAREDFNLTRQFNITGSPTLVMNGKIASESDFGGRTEQALKNLLCCGFSSKPNYCSMNLSTVVAKTGFASKVSEQPSGPSAESLKAIPLAKVGVNNPAIPVLVTDQTIAIALKKYPFFVLMGFADWCGYCRMMNSTVQELSKELQGRVTFGLIDAEKNNMTAEKYNLVSFPRLLIFRNGTLISTQTGYKNTSEFSGILKGLEPSLNASRPSITVPSAAPQTQRPGTIIEATKNAALENDTTLKYLDRILEAAEINRTTGNTINIFIININKETKK
jgi:thioredoxin 1